MMNLESPGNLFAILFPDESAKAPAANDMADGYDIAGSRAFKLSGIDHCVHSHAASTAVTHDRIEVVGSRAALDHGVAF